MGKGAAKASQSISQKVADSALNTSGQVGSMSLPWLKQAGDYYSSVASGSPSAVASATAPQLNSARGAYTQAQTQLSETMPKGGARDSAETQLGIARAGNTSGILTGGISDAIAKLANLGSGGTQISLTGDSVGNQSAGNLGNLAGMKAQAFGQGMAGLGAGAGSFLGGGSKPWIFGGGGNG